MMGIVKERRIKIVVMLVNDDDEYDDGLHDFLISLNCIIIYHENN